MPDFPESGLAEDEAGQTALARKGQVALRRRAEKIAHRQSVLDLDEPLVKAALESSNGILRQAAILLQVDYDEFRKYVAQHEEIHTFRLALRDRLVDAAETKVVNLMNSPDHGVSLRAATLILERLGGDRGWREQKEKSVSSKELSLIQNAMQAVVLQFVSPERQAAAEAMFYQKVQEGITRKNTGGMGPDSGFVRAS